MTPALFLHYILLPLHFGCS